MATKTPPPVIPVTSRRVPYQGATPPAPVTPPTKE